MSAAESGPGHPVEVPRTEDLLPIVTRVVRSTMGGHPDADDVIQEALTRVLGAVDRIGAGMVEAYAVTTARNLVASTWRDADRFRRHRHRLVDPDVPVLPGEALDAAETARR